MAEFYSANSGNIPLLPLPTFAPPLTAPREGGGVAAAAYGDLAKMIAITAGDGHKASAPRGGALGSQQPVVAGVGFGLH